MYLLFLCISILSILLYSFLIILFFYAWRRQLSFKECLVSRPIFVSIIIPARNEEKQISNILTDLTSQNYDFSFFEIVVVNDHSQDNTQLVANSYKEKLSNFSVLELPEALLGKKQSLAYAISKSKGELIITVDADCRVGKYWLSSIVSFYNQFRPKIIIGPLLYREGKSIFEKIQSVEIAGLVASGAGAAFLNHSIMCNGANLAFTREAYLKSAAMMKSHLASGDDLFLLLSVKKNWPKEICFLKSRNALALTNSESDLKNFIQQRKRWTSKARYYRDADIILTAGVVFVSNLLIVASLIAAFFQPYLFLLFVFLLAIKSVGDLLLLNSFLVFFEMKNILKYFWQAQLLYPFYILFMGVYGNIGKFKWKNRIYP